MIVYDHSGRSLDIDNIERIARVAAGQTGLTCIELDHAVLDLRDAFQPSDLLALIERVRACERRAVALESAVAVSKARHDQVLALAEILSAAFERRAPKSYFECNDNGCTYTFVAVDLDHAKKMLADSGAETSAETGGDSLEWRELTHAEARRRWCTHDDVKHDPTKPASERRNVSAPLTFFELGDWFSSEY